MEIPVVVTGLRCRWGGGQAPVAPPHFDYIVRYGIALHKPCRNYEVRGQRETAIHRLSADFDYHFAVDAFNDGGRTPGPTVVPAPAPKGNY